MRDFNMTSGHKALLSLDDDGDFGLAGSGRGDVDLRAAETPATTQVVAALSTSASSEPAVAPSDVHGGFMAGMAFGEAAMAGLMQANLPSDEIQVNTYTTSHQTQAKVAVDADGDFVVVWASSGQDGANYGVYGQRFNAAGVAQGSEFRVNTYTTSNQQNADVAMDDDGNFVVTWDSSGQDGSLLGIYAQRFNASGVAQGSEFRVNTYTTNSQGFSDVTMDSDGDFVITWGSNGQDGNGYGVYGQRYNAAGEAQGGEFQVNTYTSLAQGSSQVVSNDSGFVVVWSSTGQDGSNNGIYGQRFDASGVAQGSEFQVNTYTTSAQANAKVAMDLNGNFVVTWNSTGQDGSNDGIYAQRFNASGVAQGSEFQVNTYTTSLQKFSSVAMDDDGDFVVTWQSYGQDGSSYGVFGQYYNAAGEAQGTEFQINTYTSNFQGRAAVEMDANGNFVVTWYSTGQDGASNGVYVRLMPAPSSGPALNDLDGDATALAADGEFTALDSGTAATVTSSVLENTNWDGATVTVQRVLAGVADGSATDQYSFLTSTLFTVDATGDDFGGYTAGTIADGIADQVNVTGVLVAAAGGQAFARYYYDYATGLLTIEFGATGAGDISLTGTPTKAMIEDVLSHIGYGSSLSYGNAVIRLTLNDSVSDAKADVTVTSSTIHVDRTDDDAGGDAADGYSLREALARSVAQAGNDTVTLASIASGSTLTLSGTVATLGGGDTLLATSDQTLAAAGGGGLVLAGAATIMTGTGVNLTVSAPLTGSSPLTKAGAGTLTLSGSNSSMSGAITVAAGTLSIASDSNLGEGSVSLGAGTTLSVTVGTTIDNAIALTGAATLEAAANITLSGNLTGSSDLTKTGAGRLTLSGDNSGLNGDLIVSAGSVLISSADNLSAGVITLESGTTFSVQATSTIDNGLKLTGDALFNILNSASVTLTGALSGGDVKLTKAGNGTLILSHTGNEAGFTGGLQINAGSVQVAEDDDLVAGTLTFNGGTLRVTSATTIDNEVVFSASSTVRTDAAVTLGGSLSGEGDLTKTGSGTLTLSGDGSGMSGGISLSAGTLAVASDANLMTGTVTLGGATTLAVSGTTVIDNTVLFANAANISVATGQLVTLSGALETEGAILTKIGAGTLSLTNEGNELAFQGDVQISAGTLQVTNDDALVAGEVVLNGGRFAVTQATTIDNMVTLNAASMIDNDLALTLTGSLGGDYGLTKTGSGTLVLSGNAATLTGDITVSSGVLSVVSDAKLGGGVLYLEQGATFAVTGTTTVDNTITMTGAATIQAEVGVIATLDGALSGSSTLTKAGQGTLVLSGDGSGLSGDLYVNDGTLQVDGDLSSSGDITAFGSLTGGGTIGGAVTVQIGSISGGAGSGTGILTLGNGLTVTDGGALWVTLDGTTAGTGYDQINVTGGVVLSNAALSLSLGFSAAADDVFTIISNDGSDAVSGTFLGLAEGSTLTLGATTFRISYVGGTGNDVTMTVLDPVPDITSDATDSLAENSTGTVYQATATVATGAAVTWSLSGTDADLFHINSQTGAVTFISAPDFEAPADDGGDNVYNITVTATAGAEVAEQDVAITVTDAAEVLYGTQDDDLLMAGGGVVEVAGLGGNDTLLGSTGDDILLGGEGHDSLNGGAGGDQMQGGAGDDSFFVDSILDEVTEASGDGTDTVKATIIYVLGNNLENLTFVGEDDLEGTGNALDNGITGNSGDNLLIGDDGDDRLDGGEGADTLTGGDGDDTYGVDDVADLVTEIANEGSDTVESSITYALGDYVENLTLTGDGNIDGTGNVLDNRLTGNEGANVLTGGDGADSYIDVGEDDLVVETEDGGHDTVFTGVSHVLAANVEDLVLTGSSAADGTGNDLANVLTGNSAANRLEGGLGYDAFVGGDGDDTYVLEDNEDVVEAEDEGTDTIEINVSYSLGDNIENLTLTGHGNISGYGNELNNHIVGNSGSNLLDGGEGADTMAGGAGQFDAYFVDNADDVILEDQDGGLDVVVVTGEIAAYALSENVEAMVVGSEVAGTFTGNNLDNTFFAVGLSEVTLIGGEGNDSYQLDSEADVIVEAEDGGTDAVAVDFTYTLGAHIEDLFLMGEDDIYGYGNTLANVLTGNSGSNRLDGKAGNDTLYGGDGDDIYIVDSSDDVASEQQVTGVDDGGFDTVRASVSYTLGAFIENLRLTGSGHINATGNAQGNYLYGNSGNNALDGRGGNDIMSGGAGNDTYYADMTTESVVEAAGEGTDEVIASATFTLGDNIENLTLYSHGTNAFDGTGNAVANLITGSRGSNQLSGLDGNDQIRGGEGNDVLDGGVGADTLYGGADSDTYYIDNIGDVVSEETVEGVNDTGNDLVISTLSHTLGTYFERLTLIGSSDINATGNGQNNTLTGNSGNNTLDGGAGADTMAGGGGNDTFLVDHVSDLATEALDEGYDIVRSQVTYTLGANIEALTLLGSDDIYGTGNSLNNVIRGNSGMNRLDGKAGADTMYGGSEDDVYIVDDAGDVASEQTVTGVDDGGFDTVRASVSYTLGTFIENLRLTGSGNINGTGNSSANYLIGTSGNNVLDGSYGGDIMDGGAGNDTYYVNVATDEVIEAVAGGTDTVISQVTYTLGENIENLELASWGTAATNATGNSVANVITGGRGSNQLFGLDGADTISGGEGNDTLDGGNGVDSMAGGLGSDVYYVNDANDVVFEDAGTGTGTDTVISSVAWTLGNNVEKLTLDSSANVNGGGNTMNNTIIGNDGHNILEGFGGADTISAGIGNDVVAGGTGNDNLTGGAGADTFFFAKTGGGLDHITDFATGLDRIAFNASDFTSSLANTTFTSNGTGAAVGNTGQFIFNTATHTLVWDSNGTGSGGVTATIVFDNNVTITKADLVFLGVPV